MAENINLQKIIGFINTRQELKGKSAQEILPVLKSAGYNVTEADVQAAITTSAFGFGFNKTDYNLGTAIERENPQEVVVPYTKTKAELEEEKKAEQAFNAKIKEIRKQVQKMVESAFFNTLIPSYPISESGKKIKVEGKEISIEQFIKENLKLDLMSQEGINAYAQMLFMEDTELQNKDTDKLNNILKQMNLDISNETGRDTFMRLLNADNELIKDLDLKALETTKKFTGKQKLSFNDAADILEEQGVFIRNREELEATKDDREKRNNRNLVGTLMTAVYASQLDNLYGELQHYNDLTSSTSYREHIKELMYNVGFTFDTPTLDVAIDNTHSAKASMIVLTQESINEKLFKEQFKKYFGVEYNDEKAAKLVEALQKAGSFDFNNKEVKAAMLDLFNYDVNEDFNNRQKTNEVVDGFLGTLFMVGTMGLGGELQALNQAAKGLKGAKAALQASSTLGATGAVDQFILKNITTNPAARAVLFGGLNFGVYSAGTTSAQIVANLPDAKLSDVNAIAEGFCQSFLFGAFAAEFGMGANIVSQSVKNGLSKQLNMKVIRPLIEKFATKHVMSGEEFMQTLLKNEAKVAKVAQAAAKTTNFGLEVVGFSGYEMSLTAMNGGKPDDMSFGEYLGEVLTSQFKTLGEFKIAGFIMNSRMAQARMPRETKALLQNEKLENMEIKTLNNKGKVSYVMKDIRTGESKVYKNVAELRSRCIEIMNEPRPLDVKLQGLQVGEKLELDLGDEKIVFVRTEEGIKVEAPKLEAKTEVKADEANPGRVTETEELETDKISAKRPYEVPQVRNNDKVGTSKELLADTSKPEAYAETEVSDKSESVYADKRLNTIKITEPITEEECRKFLTEAGFSEKRLELIDLKNPTLLRNMRILRDSIEHPEIFGEEFKSDAENLLKPYSFERFQNFCKQEDETFEMLNIDNVSRIRKSLKDIQTRVEFDLSIIQYAQKNNLTIEQVCQEYIKEFDSLGEHKKYIKSITDGYHFEKCLMQTKFASELLNKGASEDDVAIMLYDVTEDTSKLAKELYESKLFNIHDISSILHSSRRCEGNEDFIIEFCKNPNFKTEEILDIVQYIDKGNIEIAKEICRDKDFPKDQIVGILCGTKPETMELAKGLCRDKEFPKDEIRMILNHTNETNMELAKGLCRDKDFPKDEIWKILWKSNETNMELAKIMCADKDFPKSIIYGILSEAKRANMELAVILCTDKDFPKDVIKSILRKTDGTNIELAKIMCADKDFPKVKIEDILAEINNINYELAKNLCLDKDFPKDAIPSILEEVRMWNIDFIKQLCSDKDFPKNKIARIVGSYREERTYIYQILCESKNISGKQKADILQDLNDRNCELAEILIRDNNFPRDEICKILTYTYNGLHVEFAKTLYKDNVKVIGSILKALDFQENADMIKTLYAEKKYQDFWENVLSNIINSENSESVKKFAYGIVNNEITPQQAFAAIDNNYNISYSDIKMAQKVFGKDFLSKLSESDTTIAFCFVKLANVKNINEIPTEAKKKLIRDLVASNTGMFNISPELAEKLPILPKTQEEYCALLPALVRSMGIETTPLTPQQRIDLFHHNMSGLSTSLAKISDADFAGLRVTQEMPKEEFISVVLDKVKDLTPQERQKVYDYYGFELHHNKTNETGFSITGYPVNLNNGKKLAQITDPATRAVVESLRPDVIRFSKENKIRCNNPEVEIFLNEIVDVMPEIRTMIGRAQHGNNGTKGSHDFDVMQHSLKVMQKIAQDPKFETLNETDKKLMLLASLMHDITKAEGAIDKTHANESSFDTFFIAKKFKLSKEEELKLYRLIKHHEWLEYVNSAKTEEQLTKRLQSVAYDLQQDNLIDLAIMFTHADLRAVKGDDTFHDTTDGKTRATFDGKTRIFDDSKGQKVSHGQAADLYVERIKGYIRELQKTQPLLPVTKVPPADIINKAITSVNPDGSTNIKGVYKDSDGLVVIKFNEVEDWEVIGFPKGSISRGIESECEDGIADTGNIKFFVHGLDYANQLSKFDAFSLVDSDVLLSVSYTERPESKFRFFRPQGVVLDVATENVHGGGNTDAGSGCGKFVQEFKNNYIFGGERESDRTYVADMVKEATGMTDEQYVRFIEENKNKDFTEIEPVELREKIIKAFATINSNTRRGNREYNEMYLSNPRVTAVFAYDVHLTSNVGKPFEFLRRTELDSEEISYYPGGSKNAKPVSERTAFLRKYALENNLPFIVFGD